MFPLGYRVAGCNRIFCIMCSFAHIPMEECVLKNDSQMIVKIITNKLVLFLLPVLYLEVGFDQSVINKTNVETSNPKPNFQLPGFFGRLNLQ